ncbi:MAG TPA: lipoyl(octanoyl) transferase LipB [Roseiflexaceae bacterium]|nr:lipoyl(octanoyl) transferase LipB [Roseiflexaceae bacterium]
MAQAQPRSIQVLRLGELAYPAAWELQRAVVARRSSGAAGDTLLLTSHPHTYTLGRATRPGHLLAPPETLAAQGVQVFEIDRGGDITYHGPGQVVAYPILKLSQHGGDLGRYLRMLEETVIDALAGFGVQAGRIPGLTGVWVAGEKICAIGVKLTASGVTQHGFALNVTTDLRFFRQIVPCGIADRGVTSLERLLGPHTPPLATVEEAVARSFGRVFGVTPVFVEEAREGVALPETLPHL